VALSRLIGLVLAGLTANAIESVSPAAAHDVLPPRVTLSEVDWQAAAHSVESDASDPRQVFAPLNAALSARFKDIGKSPVPVLLPIDLAAYRKDSDEGKAEARTSDKYFGDFTPSKFFLAGPGGYDATFYIRPREAGLKLAFIKPIEVEVGGAAYLYELDAPDKSTITPVPKELVANFPGIERVLRDAHVRYAFTRFGVPYVVSIQCYDRRPSHKYLACREADQVALRFLARLTTAGGAPAPIVAPKVDLSRPKPVSDSFTYYPPGDIIPNSGWHKMPGRIDYHVYSNIRFPIANAPAYVKSQSFMPWGDCYRTGHTGRLGRKGAPYRCKVNDIPLVFDESAAVNWTYPWRDNFCEMRDFIVGQCPGGYGHQGQDIRPSNCVINNESADRCEPYQHTVAAVHDGLIWRTPGNLAAYLVINDAGGHVRYRYLHMNPKFMDADGVVSGRAVSEGEILGKVATWGDYERGTSYHLHFNLQVFTRIGWVWVNPYMTLVTAYEHMISAHGVELEAGAPQPPVPEKLPVVLNPSPVPATPTAESTTAPNTEQSAASHPKIKPKAKSKKRHHHRRGKRHKHRSDD
jgi:hypothetical protein